MRKKIYNSLSEAILALKDDKEQPLIKHIDLWNQNVDFYADFIFPTPAVFLEFTDIRYSKVKDNRNQLADVDFSLHIVTDAPQSSAAGAYGQQASLEFLDLIEKINLAILPLDGDRFENVIRTASQTNHDHGELMENIEQYSCRGCSPLK